MSVSLKISSKAVKPEKQVEQSIRFWCLQNKWDVEIYDSETIPGRFGKRIRNPGLPIGTPDLMGHTEEGLAVYIELKKKKARGLCRESQYYFLRRKIESGAFAVCTDSVDHLSETYLQWLEHRAKGQGVHFLTSKLPKKLLSGGRVVLAPT